MSVIGTPVRRREDYRFLTGQGTYTDDINRPGQLHAYILRSPHANARISGIDTSAAASAPVWRKRRRNRLAQMRLFAAFVRISMTSVNW